jgi:antirestriction protein ArdC
MSIYEIITEQILKKLEAGEIPWHKPWTGGEYPKNLVSKKEYRGINLFLLDCQKYSSPFWLTYKQATDLGGFVRPGEKGSKVVFWKTEKSKDEDRPEDDSDQKNYKFILRYYIVFNLDQCDGIDEKKIPQTEKKPNFQPLSECESILNGMPNKPLIKFEESRAYYRPSEDFVNMPKPEIFDKPEFYYSVLFHEIGHATGHQSRLGRHKQSEMSSFGSENYSKEELVAEMTASFICGKCQIEQETIENSAAYIQSWLKALKNDSKMVVLAAAQAQRAADYIQGVKYEN